MATLFVITIDKYTQIFVAHNQAYAAVMHGRRNRGGQGGGQLPPPNILPTPKIQDCKNNDI